jgi:hypothetical protein
MVMPGTVSLTQYLPPWDGLGSSPQWLTLNGFGHSDGEGKKLPRLFYVQSTGLWPAHLTELRCHYVRVGHGFGDFLDLREKISS